MDRCLSTFKDNTPKLQSNYITFCCFWYLLLCCFFVVFFFFFFCLFVVVVFFFVFFLGGWGEGDVVVVIFYFVFFTRFFSFSYFLVSSLSDQIGSYANHADHLR